MATQILTLTKITVNGVPTLAEGVEPEAEAETAHGQAYELDLDSIFADPNDDEMTYTVSVNGAEPVAADAAYSYTPDENGETTLVFTASDGSALASAATYTVKLTAKDPNTIHVTVSITKYGQIVTGKDGALVAQLPIELNTKLSYTISDALEAAHEAAYEGGAAAGYATYVSAWGPGISMLWGDTSYNFGYQVNAGTVAVMGVGDAINDGDAIDAYVAQNAYPDTEAYAVFDQAAATIETGNALDLVLKESFFDPDTYAMSMVPCVGAAVHVNGESAEGAPVTDDAGKASISFDKPGTYVVTATKTKVVGENTVTAITAPVCTVTVMQNKAALRDAIAAAEAADVALASDETKTALADKLAAAKATLEKADATEDEIAAAASELATATANAVASAKENAANGLPVGSTFTVKDANGTWTYKVTATKQVTLTKATATKKKGKVTINTVAYQGVTYNVTAIGSNALKGSKLASVVVGDNVTSIGAQAFAKSKLLKKMTIGKNVASIGAKAFKGDKKLKKITLKSAKLTSKKAVKGSLKGSKVKTIKLSGMNKAAKKQVKKAFKKAGKKGVKVK